MQHPKAFSLHLVATATRPEGSNHIENNGSAVIVGANGSGKTRLGSWIEFHSKHKENVHRISAQKSLNMPEFVNSAPYHSARSDLLYGTSEKFIVSFGGKRDFEDHKHEYKQNHRWSRNPATFLLNDFEKLLVFLFSEESEKGFAYRRAARSGATPNVPPETKLDIIASKWNDPARECGAEVTTGRLPN